MEDNVNWAGDPAKNSMREFTWEARRGHRGLVFWKARPGHFDLQSCRKQLKNLIPSQVSFEEYVCRQKALKKGEDSCLAEQLQKLKKKKKSKKEKGETGSKTELWLTWSFVPVLYSYFLLTPPGPPGLTSAVNFRESGWRWAVGWGWILQFFVVDKDEQSCWLAGEGVPRPRPIALFGAGWAERCWPAPASGVPGSVTLR